MKLEPGDIIADVIYIGTNSEPIKCIHRNQNRGTFMKLILLMIGIIVLTGCVSMPGDLKTTESKTDGTTETSVTPGWLYNSPIRLGVYKTNIMNPDEAYLIVELQLDSIRTKDGLLINVDGEKTTLSSIDTISNLRENFFRKRFPIKMDLLKKMVNGKSVWIQVRDNGQSKVEGEFSTDGMTTARPGFRKFLAALKM